MTKIALLAAASALVLAGGASAKAVHPTLSFKHEPKHSIIFPHNGLSVLYDQSEADNGIGIVSQNFESSFDAYDSQGADDFTVPAGQIWKVSEIDVSGAYFNGSGPAPSFDLSVFGIKKGKFVRIYSCNSGLFYDVNIDEYKFHLLDAGCGVAKVKGGTMGKKVWLSVQANMDVNAGGEWGWNTNNTVRGYPSVWKNPGDGFATGCTDFTETTTCIPSGEGGDFAFALLGKQNKATEQS